MKLIMMPLVLIGGFYLYEARDKIIDQYYAAYPSDPAKAQAMARCIALDPNFNRLDTDDRDRCYRAMLSPAVPRALTPTPSPTPSYADNPSHLPGNDIRREQANDNFLIHSATAAPAAPTPGTVPKASAPHPAHTGAAVHPRVTPPAPDHAN